uniref:Linker for activation of T cells n=1 Tax=Anas platyrhynchos TaxID=8839 RepID=A0A9N6YKB3_ANAPL|nr:TPA_inf: linker for activation of T cells [Anas platyrhynchos]
MEALWGLALLPPALLLAALCTRCYRRHSAPMDEECKTPQPVPTSSFMVITPSRCSSHAPPQQRPPVVEPNLPLPSPQPPQQRRVSAARPQPERAPTPPAPDDDYSNELYATGYVVVLPDPQGEARGGGSPQDRDSGSTALQDKEYENVPEGPRRSLADSLEYINVPAAGSSPASRYGSDRESEGDGPDYENVARTSPHP